MTVLPQHMQALANANLKRGRVADFRRDTKRLMPAAAAARVADVIDAEHGDYVLGSARIGHLLTSIPQLGEKRMTKCLLAAGVHNFDRKLRDLTPRQRAAVVLQLRVWAVGWQR